MSDTDDPTDPATMDRLLPYLEAGDCDAALRLLGTMLEAGLMTQREAAEWTVRLRAWKAAHESEPEAEA